MGILCRLKKLECKLNELGISSTTYSLNINETIRQGEILSQDYNVVGLKPNKPIAIDFSVAIPEHILIFYYVNGNDTLRIQAESQGDDFILNTTISIIQ